MTIHRVDDGRADTPVIELLQVGKVYSTGSLEVEALVDVSLQIDSNEFVAVIGPSGSGKSTLMHILGCLDVPTSGVFRLAGHDVQALDEDRLALVRNLYIGFVFQQFNLLAYLPAWRNVALPLVYTGMAPAERRERALEALAKVGLADRSEHKPGRVVGRAAATGRGRTCARHRAGDDPGRRAQRQSRFEVDC